MALPYLTERHLSASMTCLTPLPLCHNRSAHESSIEHATSKGYQDERVAESHVSRDARAPGCSSGVRYDPAGRFLCSGARRRRARFSYSTRPVARFAKTGQKRRDCSWKYFAPSQFGKDMLPIRHETQSPRVNDGHVFSARRTSGWVSAGDQTWLVDAWAFATDPRSVYNGTR
jgi:hypothetical protein